MKRCPINRRPFVLSRISFNVSGVTGGLTQIQHGRLLPAYGASPKNEGPETRHCQSGRMVLLLAA